RSATHAPIDQSLASINEPFFIEPHKHFADRARKPLVQRKPFSSPVTGPAESAKLAKDRVAALFLPFPDSFLKRFATQIVARFSLSCQLAFNNILGGDSRMVGAWQPESIEPLHPSPAHNDVVQRVDEHVPYVQRARYVGRRYHNHKGGPGGMDVRYE